MLIIFLIYLLYQLEEFHAANLALQADRAKSANDTAAELEALRQFKNGMIWLAPLGRLITFVFVIELLHLMGALEVVIKFITG